MNSEEFNNLKASIRAVLLSLGKTATEHEFRRAFYEIESRKFYEVLEELNMSFIELFSKIPDVARLTYAYGQILIQRVSNEETCHMDQLTINKFSKNYRGPMFVTNYGLIKTPVRPLRVEALPYSYFSVGPPPKISNNYYYPRFSQPNVNIEIAVNNNPTTRNPQFDQSYVNIPSTSNWSQLAPTGAMPHFQLQATTTYSSRNNTLEYNDTPSTSGYTGNNRNNFSTPKTPESSSFENSYSVMQPLTSSPKNENIATKVDYNISLSNETSSGLIEEDNNSTTSKESEKTLSNETCSTAYVTSPNQRNIVKEDQKVTPAKIKPAASSTKLNIQRNISRVVPGSSKDSRNSATKKIGDLKSKQPQEKKTSVLSEKANNEKDQHDKGNVNANLQIFESDLAKNSIKTTDLIKNIIAENNAKEKDNKKNLQEEITNRENITEALNQSNDENSSNLPILKSELAKERMKCLHSIKNVLFENETNDNNKKVSNEPTFSKEMMDSCVELPPITFDENNPVFEIKILDVLSLTKFTFQFSLDKLTELNEKLNQFYNNLQDIDNYKIEELAFDSIVAVRYNDSWYRGQITSADDSEVYVKFVDYLKIAPINVSPKDILRLHQDFTTESPKSAIGRIHGLKSNDEVDWNILSDYKLINYEGEKVWVIFKSVKDEVFALSIMDNFKRMIDGLIEESLAELDPNDFNDDLIL